MFESGAPSMVDEDWFDPAWLEEPPADLDGPVPAARCAPSGWTALELDHVTATPGRLSDAELLDATVGFERVASWVGARQSALLAEFARRRPAEESQPGRRETPARDSGYAADEVALALGISRRAAAERLTRAEVLEADLPATRAAWESGQIDSLKARAIVEASYVLPPARRGALEDRVLAKAPQQPVARVREALRRAILALDPHGARDRFALRRSERRVVVTPDEDGMASLWALLTATDATAAYRHLGDLARGMGSEDPRGMDARRADLLVDLLTGEVPAPRVAEPEQNAAAGTTTSGAAKRAPDRNSRRSQPPGKPLVSVIVPITMLLGLDDLPGELVGYGPIPAELAREIAAEGTWRRLLTDPATGALLDYGHTTYTPPASLAAYVRARDVYCGHPGCGQPAAIADLDHTVPWPDGPTSADNIKPRCRHHHLLKTFALGWRFTQHPDGSASCTTPTGHTYTSHPHDYRAPSGPPPSRPPPAGPAPPGTSPPGSDPPPF